MADESGGGMGNVADMSAKMAKIKEDPWAHRSQGMLCESCMWYVRKIPSMNMGRCRRHAPTMSGYPVVFTSDWCGDHKLTEGAG